MQDERKVPAPLAIYIHIPFCVKRCGYCDFNTYADSGALVEPYTECLAREISAAAERGQAAGTVFFGGGTPTYLSGGQLANLLNAVRSAFRLTEECEITAEANPTTADVERFEQMRAAGFNRLSIGVQSFDPGLLRTLDRTHDPNQAREAVRSARRAGFHNVSIDLMFGLPGQTMDQWRQTLTEALALRTEHISLYGLTLEPGTRFERLHAAGRLSKADEELEARMYELAIEELTGAGFEHYEISNFARPGFRARHNMVYWRNDPYRGFGAGAVSYMDGTRWMNVRHPREYVRRVRTGEPLAVEQERLDARAALGETLMVGLRLLEGVAFERLERRFGPALVAPVREELGKLGARGLVELDDTGFRLTKQGLMVADSVALALLG
jgi:oxygen-independent coproporphyrinogen-3 oxidase